VVLLRSLNFDLSKNQKYQTLAAEAWTRRCQRCVLNDLTPIADLHIKRGEAQAHVALASANVMSACVAQLNFRPIRVHSPVNAPTSFTMLRLSFVSGIRQVTDGGGQSLSLAATSSATMSAWAPR